MKKTERLDETVAPDGTILTLYRHDGAYLVRAGSAELMSSRRCHSEERLAEVVCEPLAARRGVTVLVGGLGLGFTLRAALRVLPADATVVVVELVEGIIRWNESEEYELARLELRDPRVVLRHDDVARVLAANPGAYDAIMLDVDNGAEAFTTAGNAQLYVYNGVRTAKAALRRGGRLAYWSSTPDEEFAEVLRSAGLDVEVVVARAHRTGGPRHTIFVAS